MKGQFNKKGELVIERAGKFKTQKCKENKHYNCDDSCPLMSELKHRYYNIAPNIKLEICDRRVLQFKEFTDNRGGEDEE